MIQKPRLTALDREIARNTVAFGELLAKISQSRSKISETKLEIVQLDKDASNEIGKELRDVETKIGELNERRIAAEAQLKRVDIRVPNRGTVHQLNVHTVGG